MGGIVKAGRTAAEAYSLAKRDSNGSLWANIFEPKAGADLADQLAAWGLFVTLTAGNQLPVMLTVPWSNTVDLVIQIGVENIAAGSTETVTLPSSVDYHLAVFTQFNHTSGTYQGSVTSLTTTQFDINNQVGAALDFYWISIGQNGSNT